MPAIDECEPQVIRALENAGEPIPDADYYDMYRS